MLPPLPSGTVLRDRYILVEVVGQGGMGSVYRADDARLPGRLCAVKEVQIDPTTSPDAAAQQQAQFLQEASILAQLDHPNLPKVSDFFHQDGRDYLVMDYVPGKDLKQILDEALSKQEEIPEREVINWAMQILDAISYLHRHNPPVLHRDIKPSNIKLTPDKRIKLVDFGLAKLLLTDDMRTITVVQGRGTELYTPLEQYGGDGTHTDVRSDIYSLGATLYTLLTGSPPPSAKERFLNPRLLKSPKQRRSNVSVTVSQAIMWTLEMHPDRRPKDSQTFRAALRGETSPLFGGPGIRLVPDWFIGLQANQRALMLSGILFLIAVLLTLGLS